MATPELSAGTALGNYTIVREIGRGGMGIVYLAHEEALGRHVALKVLAPWLARDRVVLGRFLQEARAAARLSHPNIIRVYSVGEQEGVHFIAMEYVAGQSLSEAIRGAGGLKIDRAMDVTRQVGEALAHAHAQGIIHRDIKPQNILVGEDGVVKVADFGLAKVVQTAGEFTAAGSRIGSPAYMSPEQCEGGDVDGRTDVYSLGVTLFEMLTGSPPYEGASPLAVMYQITREPLPELSAVREDVPLDVERILAGMLAKDRDDRFGSAEELGKALRATVSSGEVGGGSGSTLFGRRRAAARGAKTARPWASLRRGMYAAGGVLAVLCIAFLARRGPQGDVAPVIFADSIAGFSGVQGENGWYYGYYERPGESGSFAQAPAFTGDRWVCPEKGQWFMLSNEELHPDVTPFWAVRRWVSEVAGPVRIVGEVTKTQIDGGDGATAHILVDGESVWSKFLPGTDGTSTFFDVEATVKKGSPVDFALDPGAIESAFDRARFTAAIHQAGGSSSDSAGPTKGQRVVADSVKDFSGEQGTDNWFYGYYETSGNSATFREMTLFTHDRRWASGKDWGQRLLREGGVPAMDSWTVRRWISPAAGTVTVYGDFAKLDANPAGDGATGHILLDGQEIWSEHIDSNDRQGQFYTIDATVAAGSVLDFAIDCFGDTRYDTVRFTATMAAPEELVDSGQNKSAYRLITDSAADFSGTQGYANWYYGYYRVQSDPNTFEEMPDFEANQADGYLNRGVWHRPGDNWHALWFQGGSPAWEQPAVRRWISDTEGPIVIAGMLSKNDAEAAQHSVTGRVFVDGHDVGSGQVGGDQPEELLFSIETSVRNGSMVDLVVSADDAEQEGNALCYVQIRGAR